MFEPRYQWLKFDGFKDIFSQFDKNTKNRYFQKKPLSNSCLLFLEEWTCHKYQPDWNVYAKVTPGK